VSFHLQPRSPAHTARLRKGREAVIFLAARTNRSKVDSPAPVAPDGTAFGGACRVAGQTVPPSPLVRRRAVDDPNAALRAWLRQYAKDHPRPSSCRPTMIARQGWNGESQERSHGFGEKGLRVPRVAAESGVDISPPLLATVTADALTGVGVRLPFRLHHRGRPIKIVSTSTSTPAMPRRYGRAQHHRVDTSRIAGPPGQPAGHPARGGWLWQRTQLACAQC